MGVSTSNLVLLNVGVTGMVSSQVIAKSINSGIMEDDKVTIHQFYKFRDDENNIADKELTNIKG